MAKIGLSDLCTSISMSTCTLISPFTEAVRCRSRVCTADILAQYLPLFSFPSFPSHFLSFFLCLTECYNSCAFVVFILIRNGCGTGLYWFLLERDKDISLVTSVQKKGDSTREKNTCNKYRIYLLVSLSFPAKLLL